VDAGRDATFRRPRALAVPDVSEEHRRDGLRSPVDHSGRRAVPDLLAVTHRLSRPQAAIVVTGSELVRGDRNDLNGPLYAREALRLGLEPSRIAIVGDKPDDLRG